MCRKKFIIFQKSLTSDLVHVLALVLLIIGQNKVFWELPHWKTNLIRHNLDVMHIEKNLFDSIFNTVMDIKDKMKDNVKARMDLKEYCRQNELELHQLPNGRYLKPKAKFTLTMDQKMAVYKWVNELRCPMFMLPICIDV